MNKFKKTIEKALNSLYHAEDLNGYKNNLVGKKINKAIILLNEINKEVKP